MHPTRPSVQSGTGGYYGPGTGTSGGRSGVNGGLRRPIMSNDTCRACGKTGHVRLIQLYKFLFLYLPYFFFLKKKCISMLSNVLNVSILITASRSITNTLTGSKVA